MIILTIILALGTALALAGIIYPTYNVYKTRATCSVLESYAAGITSMCWIGIFGDLSQCLGRAIKVLLFLHFGVPL